MLFQFFYLMYNGRDSPLALFLVEIVPMHYAGVSEAQYIVPEFDILGSNSTLSMSSIHIIKPLSTK